MTFGMSSPQSNLTRMLDLSGSLQTSLVSVSSDRSNRLRFIFFRIAGTSNAAKRSDSSIMGAAVLRRPRFVDYSIA